MVAPSIQSRSEKGFSHSLTITIEMHVIETQIPTVKYLNNMRHGQHLSSTSGQAEFLHSSFLKSTTGKDTEDTAFANKRKDWPSVNNDNC
jgi:hypothetical protein